MNFDQIATIVGCTLIGSVSWYMGGKISSLERKTRQWPSVKGKILKIWLDVPKFGGDVPADRSIFAEYEYEVNGVVHKGHHVYASEIMGAVRSRLSKSQMKILKNIPSEPPVYYDVEKPEVSYLLKESRFLGPFVRVAGALILTFDVLYILILTTT